MVNNCANPACGKPLHYLREGRVYVFAVAGAQTDARGKHVSTLQHYWLCGVCSQNMTMIQDAQGIRTAPKPSHQTARCPTSNSVPAE